MTPLLLAALLTVLALAICVAFTPLIVERSRLKARSKQVEAPANEKTSEWMAWLPEPQFAIASGLRIRYVQAGFGPDLVLLHGIGASLHVWRFLIRDLSKHFRVTALDLPGFGMSDAASDGDYGLDAQCQRAMSALDLLGIGRCGLVGSSMGGAIALWMSKLDPARFPEVAVLGPAVDRALAPLGAARLGVAVGRFGNLLSQALGPRSMRLILSRVNARAELISDVSVAAYLSPYREGSSAQSAFWSALRLISDPRLPSELANPAARVLVLYGERDRIVSRQSIERYLRVAPSAELREHPHGGHHIMEDEPAWTLKSLDHFFSPVILTDHSSSKSRLDDA